MAHVFPSLEGDSRSVEADSRAPRDRLGLDDVVPRDSPDSGLAFAPAAQPLWLAPHTTAALKAVSESHGVPLSTTLLAAFQAFLYRQTGREDISVGIFVPRRKSAEGAASLPSAPCVARADFTDDPPFHQFLLRVRSALTDGAPVLYRSPSQASVSAGQAADVSPLGSFLFRFGAGSAWEWAAAKCDLALSLSEEEGGLRGAFLYDAELLDTSTIQHLRGHFLTLLEGVAADPDQRVGLLPFLTPAERHQILFEWNDTKADFSRNPVPRLFEAQVERTPDRVAVEFQSRCLTYRELDARANALARRLTELGVGPEVLVGICVERSAEMLVALLAVLKAGGAYVPMDPAYPKDRLAYILGDSAAPVVITEKRLADVLPAAKVHRVLLEDATEEAATPPERLVSSDSLAYVIYTSGSTGRPKGVLVTHGALTNLLLSMRIQPGMGGDDVLLAVTTLSFDIAGLELYLPLVAGGRLVVASRETASDATLLGGELERCGATVMQATPATWRMLLDSGWPGRRGLKILCGGEAMSPQLASRLCDAGDSVWNLYGPTETTIWSSCERVEKPEDGKVSIGRPIANTRMYVLDAKMGPVPVGMLGELCIGGAGVARGYRNLPELTAQKFLADPFEVGGRVYCTGDLARYLPDGRIEFLGRLDHQVKVRGFRIELGEVETVLARHPAVRECVAVALPDGSGERRLVAYVVARDRTPTTAELRAFVMEALPEYMVPAVFVPLSRLPLTPNGKVDRRALPAPGPERAQLGRSFVAPRDALELGLAKIWEKVLGVESVGVRDDFFELGGHSLVAGRLFAAIQKSFDRNLPPTTLLRAPTIEQLAALLRGDQEVSHWSSLVPIQTGSRPPLFCMHAGAGTILFYYDLARELGPDQPVYGLQAQGLYGGLPPHAEVEEMAAHYASEIRTVQPSGPYLLAGFCFGGLLALAVAHQLRREGRDVALLVSFDGGSPRFDYAAPTGSEVSSGISNKRIARSWTSRHWANLRRLPNREKLAYLAKKAKTRFEIWRLELGNRFHALLLPVGDLYRAFGRPLPEVLRHTYFRSKSLRATKRYSPPPYPGRMVLFESRGRFQDTHLGWDGWVVGGLEVHEIPVAELQPGRYHASFISAVGKPLREVLRAVAAPMGASNLSRASR